MLEQLADFLAAACTLEQLSLPQQLGGDMLQGEALEAIEGGSQQLDTVENHPSRALHRAPLALIVALAPVQWAPVTPQQQAPAQGICHPLQVPGIEIDHVPADQHIRIFRRQPL